MSNKTKMSHSRRSMTKHSFRSRFTDGEFPPIRSIPPTDNLLMEYLCQFRENNEISTEEYKEYVDDQLDRIRENNVTIHLYYSVFSKFSFILHFFLFLFIGNHDADEIGWKKLLQRICDGKN